ncbi:hypothetical protein GCM10023080_043920 [Streptomyces pseudoechinosporeus]
MKSPNVRRRRGNGCGVRFRGPGELPVELEVVRRAMAGVLVSCVEGGVWGCSEPTEILRRVSKAGQWAPVL